MARCKVLIVDDEPSIRNGIKYILEACGAELAGEADNGLSGIEEAQRSDADVVLLDLSMPVMGGFAAARELRRCMPATRIIFVSQYSDCVYADEALAIGAVGYVLKQSAARELPTAIEAVMAGQTFISPSMKSRIASR